MGDGVKMGTGYESTVGSIKKIRIELTRVTSAGNPFSMPGYY